MCHKLVTVQAQGHHLRYRPCNITTLSLIQLVSNPDPPPMRKGGSGEYSTSLHYGVAVAMDSAYDSAKS